ncbi:MULTISPECIES: hypothetical protein [Streptomyces]|uniref:Uncharacterized protein n=4 Tax=Streptomyces TaxID=1883 RepID=A0A8H9LKW9_9ACTN|nr:MULTISPECIES: hypothetical protein [Streptomyces]NEE35996.1 hypothetical protein [Streptomyces sp. SID7982]NEE49815.1 hypothetical protein [Streptomyces sp. SID8455]MBL3803668.1 hypothetical protein [Streptomyces sp. BRB081]MDQ0292673.1 hypothetical protein [Streptomyces sp. DSM 41037]NEC11030.1 hypothetical protein [Streptomyces sp. SID8014]
MRKILEIAGFLLLLQGAMGLVTAFTDRFDVGLVSRIGFLDGYEVYASIAALVLAVALFAVASGRPE